MEKKPQVKIIGNDGNAFTIMAACKRAARKAGWSSERIDEVIKRMMMGNYDNLLMVACAEFDVS